MESAEFPFGQLVPPPRKLYPGPGIVRVGGAIEVRDGGCFAAGSWLRSRLREFQLAERGPGALLVELGLAGDGQAGSYQLKILPTQGRVSLQARDEQGLFAAIATLYQLLVLAPRDEEDQRYLPGLVIEDEPLFARRGFLLDVSRDRVPGMPELLSLVDHLALLKYNELQLYIEHTFAFPGHEAVWSNSSPFTPEELRALDAHARSRGIELVPNQNCLGHWHRWLTHPDYRSLAEVPEGVDHAFSLEKEPFSLCPADERVLPLLEELFEAYLPCFTSSEFNVGLDETYDLGQGRSRAACDERGTGRVYLEHLRAVHERVARYRLRMQFWGDIIVNHPELVPELPEDSIALAWGYEAGHPFEQQGALFAKSGLDFHVCPGTSSWQALTGRLGNLRTNLAQAARAGFEHGARGYLVTDWGDYGHWQPATVSWPGLVLGASYAWSGNEPKDDLERILSRFLQQGHPERHLLSCQVIELAQVSERTGWNTVNGTPFFFLLKFLHDPLTEERYPGFNRDGLAQAEVELERCASELRTIPAGEPHSGFLSRELAWAADLARLTAQIGVARVEAGAEQPIQAQPRKQREAWAEELDHLVGVYRDLWPLRSRPGGLVDSAGRLLISKATLLRDN